MVPPSDVVQYQKVNIKGEIIVQTVVSLHKFARLGHLPQSPYITRTRLVTLFYNLKIEPDKQTLKNYFDKVYLVSVKISDHIYSYHAKYQYF